MRTWTRTVGPCRARRIPWWGGAVTAALTALALCPLLGSGPGGALLAQSPQDIFWERLETLCGQAFEGTLIEAPEEDSWWDAERLVMHVRQCQEEEIRIPLHVDDDRSRTWVVSRTDEGLRLKHDHRLRDGTPDTANTDYGGDTTRSGSIWRQEFPADVYSVGVNPARASQLWYLEIRPDDAFVYGLRREATGLRYRVEFDLTRPVEPPPPPWGFEDIEATEPGERAARAQLPAVHVLATGGTISNTEGDRLTGRELVRGLPALGNLARISVEQFSNVASGAITLEQWLQMSARIDELFSQQEDLAGVVITHGTDTMEETAYFLDLTLAHCRPVVVTGAMRRASMPGADGPANLLNSVRLSVMEEAREIGAVVLMNDEILPGREATKINTSRVNAFTAGGTGRLGVADPDTVALERMPRSRECGRAAFDLSNAGELPRVDIVYTHLGADGVQVRSALEAGTRGIVVAAVGRGGTSPAQRQALEEARARGVPVVLSSRTGAGRVPVERDQGPWPPVADEGRDGAREEVSGAAAEAGAPEPAETQPAPLLGAGDLNPQKARILLMLALTRTDDLEELREIFRTH